MSRIKCEDCNEELLATNVELCPYCGSKNLIKNVKKEVNISEKLAEISKLERSGKYGKAAKEYEKLGMQKEAKNCKRLGIVEANKLEKAGKYGKAARMYEDLEMWEKAYNSLKIKVRNIAKKI